MYQILCQDITTFEGDAILNSLGAGPYRITQAPGGVFRSILKAVENRTPLLDEVMMQGSHLEYCDVFATDSYGLPCKKIIHVISPYFYDDDGFSLLKKAYENVLEFAYSNGIRSICLPLIGTGANGYLDDESFKAAKETAFAFFEKHQDFDVFVTIYLQTRSQSEEPFSNEATYFDNQSSLLNKQKRYQQEREHISTRKPTSLPIEYRVQKPTLGSPIPSVLINMNRLGLKVGDSFGRLIDLFIIARDGKDDKETIKHGWDHIQQEIAGAREDNAEDEDDAGIGTIYRTKWHKHPAYKKKSRDKKKGIVVPPTKRKQTNEENPNDPWDKPDKVHVLLTACALNMSEYQFKFLLNFCGYYLSPFDKDDLAIAACYDHLASEDQEAAILDACTTYQSKSGKTIFKKQASPFKK